MRQCEKEKQPVDTVLAGEGRQETWQKQVCGGMEAKATMSDW